MERIDYRYSVEVKVKDGWQWISGGDDLNNEKHYVRRRVDQNPGLMGRVIDKTTGETVFIDPDPDALKIRFREGDDWRSLELIYVDEEGKWLNLRDGSMMGIWLPIEQVHPDDREAMLEFGKNMERKEVSPEEIKTWGEIYRFIRQRAAYLRSKKAQEEEKADTEDN